MKRISVGLLFAAALIAFALLGTDGPEDVSPVPRTVVTAVLAGLVLWKVVDFIRRHRVSGQPREEVPTDIRG